MIKEINSLQNNLIKLIKSLEIKKNIIKHDVCFIESEKIIIELLNSNFQVKNLFVTEYKYNKLKHILNKFNNIETIIISEKVAKHISNLVTNDGVFALVKIPKNQTFNNNENFLVLDSLQDTANLGAILRSAVAFNFKQVIIINGVYPFLSKVIRNSMGYVFKCIFLNLSYNEFQEFYEQQNIHLIAAHLNGESLKSFTPPKHNYGLVVGNEGNGISDFVLNLSSQLVKIPMNNDVESLNAAVSSSIIMYELTK